MLLKDYNFKQLASPQTNGPRECENKQLANKIEKEIVGTTRSGNGNSKRQLLSEEQKRKIDEISAQLKAIQSFYQLKVHQV
jgi:hypothetical protein